MPRTPVKKSKGSSKALVPRKTSTNPAKLAKMRKKRPAKASSYEIEERRKKVVRLRMRGLGYRAIAKILNVGHMTVKRDLENIREENHQKVTRFEQEETIGECLTVFQEVELKAWEQFDSLPLGSHHGAKYLDQIQTARNNQIKLLADVGLIKKEPNKVDVRVNTAAIQQWTPEAQDLVAMAIIKAKLSPPQEPRPDNNRVIDVQSESEQEGEPKQLQAAGATKGSS